MNNNVSKLANMLATKIKRTVVAHDDRVGQKSFETEATTLGELKKELKERGYNYDNTRYTEATSRTELLDDNSPLPVNIPYRGNITNDLVLVMTPRKNINSGMVNVETASYKELKAEVKDLCNTSKTEKEARSHFGNYTQMSTATMRDLLKKWYAKNGVSKPCCGKKDCGCSKSQKVKSYGGKLQATPTNTTGNKQSKIDELNTKLMSNDLTPAGGLSSEIAKELKEGLEYIEVGIKMVQNTIYPFLEKKPMQSSELNDLISRVNTRR